MSGRDRILLDDPSEADGPAATPGKPAAPRRKRFALALLGLAVLGGGGWAGFEYVTVGRWMIETDDAYVTADITLISSRVQGYVAEVPVRENQHVREGDILVRLDDGDFRIALQTARSRARTAEQTLARIDAQIAAARAGVAQARAARDAAAARLNSARTSAERFRELAKRNVAAQSQLDEAEDRLVAETANLAAAEAAITSALAQVDVLVAQRAEAAGAKHEYELAVAQAQRDLDLTVLRAPADGLVSNLTLETGDLVQPGTRLAALVPDSGLYIEANYKETQLHGIEPGASVEVALDAIPDRTFTGFVESISPATGSVFSLLPADNATGNFTKVVQRVPVRIALPRELEESGHLRAGLSAVVAVDRRTGGGASRVAALDD